MCKKILSDLDSVIRRVNTHPEYNRHQTQKFLQELRKEADNHSVVMEMEAQHSGSAKPWQQQGNGKHIKSRCESIRRLEEGWNHIALNGFSVGTLTSLGYIIEPHEDNMGFRKKDVVFGDFDGSDPTRIMSDIYNLTLDIDALKDQRRHPVIVASAAHIGFVNIHPYMDGNGRAARMVQEFLLQADGYTPAIIPANEGHQYRKLMASVLADRRHMISTAFEPSAHEQNFYEYIASKSLLSAKSLEDSLRKRRVYSVTVEGTNIGTKLALRHILHEGLNSRTPEAVSVRMYTKDPCSQAHYEIRGDVSLEEVRSIVTKVSERYGFTSRSVEPYQHCSEMPHTQNGH